MKASLSLFAVLSLLVSTAYAQKITINWDDDIVCDEPLGEVCYEKTKTLVTVDVAFEGNGSENTLLFDDEDTWKECELANSTVIGTEFDSTPEGEKPAKGGRYFALDESCSKRYKVIFAPKKFPGDSAYKASNTFCAGTAIETDLGSDGKKCLKICKFNLVTSCGGFQVTGKGKNRSCTFYEIGAELGNPTTSSDPKTNCRLAKIPKDVDLSGV